MIAGGRPGVEAWIEARCAARRRQDGESYTYRIIAPFCRGTHTSAESAHFSVSHQRVPGGRLRIAWPPERRGPGFGRHGGASG